MSELTTALKKLEKEFNSDKWSHIELSTKEAIALHLYIVSLTGKLESLQYSLDQYQLKELHK